MPFIKVEKLLDKSIQKAGISSQLYSVQVLDEFLPVMKKFFGEQTIKKIKPLYLKEGVLSVACLSSVLAEDLKNQEKRILNELNRPYKEKVVLKLRFLA
ncbi:MAG: DciA family protein [Candidatus Buchananbacteria bacterium]